MFNLTTEEEIRQGKVTDVYFLRTRQILESLGINKRVKAEFIVKKFPDDYKWGILAGAEDCIKLLEGFKGVNVSSMQEGTIFREMEPVMVIEGDYLDFGVYETALLGFLCQASGIATKSARCKKAADTRAVISFGARRIHPAIAAVVERSAYIGGCDGVAAVKSAQVLGIEPTGTMPHALILLVGDSVKAIKAFHQIMDKGLKRIALVDTLSDEKFEALAAAEALGKDLYGVRLDTPASRRGDFLQILKEVRWELDLRGFNYVKIIVSGGIDEDDILQLNPVVDAYGVGTSISNAPVLDFAMDIVEIEGRPIAKRGKYSGEKQVWRCPECFASYISPAAVYISKAKICKCGVDYDGLLSVSIKNGAIAKELPTAHNIRDYVLEQLKSYGL